MKKSIAFVGGGTGGHVFPIKSMIEYLYNNNIDKNIGKVFWIGENNSLEQKIAEELSNKYPIIFAKIMSGKLRRYLGLKPILLNTIDIFKFMVGIFQSLYLIFFNKIDIIFCKGGYVCLPVVLAAKLLGKQIYVHESDTVAGLTNKIAAKFATKNFVGFENVLPNSLNVGQILSNELLDFDDNISQLSNLDFKITNILIFGGSQGSRVLYQSVLVLLERGIFVDCNLFIVLGLKNLYLKKDFEKYSNVFIFDFLTQKQLGYVYTISDICITRGGATSLAELKYFGLKLIIVPLPFTGGNHQFFNAKEYVRLYEDILVEQNENLSNGLQEAFAKIGKIKKQKLKVADLQQNIAIIFKEILK